MSLVQSARDLFRTAQKATVEASKEMGRFAHKHRETIAGGVGGYAAGRALEQIPLVGKLIKPVASLVLGIGGLAYGYQKELERRRVEAQERGGG